MPGFVQNGCHCPDGSGAYARFPLSFGECRRDARGEQPRKGGYEGGLSADLCQTALKGGSPLALPAMADALRGGGCTTLGPQPCGRRVRRFTLRRYACYPAVTLADGDCAAARLSVPTGRQRPATLQSPCVKRLVTPASRGFRLPLIQRTATLSRRTAREVRAFVPTGPAFLPLVIRVAGPGGPCTHRCGISTRPDPARKLGA
ncbi:hypothetical protein R11007_02880 [Ralstonia holmesii]|nr:hypothetical protein R11007_02880 [Ralstonia sp. LMG 32967]